MEPPKRARRTISVPSFARVRVMRDPPVELTGFLVQDASLDHFVIITSSASLHTGITHNEVEIWLGSNPCTIERIVSSGRLALFFIQDFVGIKPLKYCSDQQGTHHVVDVWTKEEHVLLPLPLISHDVRMPGSPVMSLSHDVIGVYLGHHDDIVYLHEMPTPQEEIWSRQQCEHVIHNSNIARDWYRLSPPNDNVETRDMSWWHTPTYLHAPPFPFDYQVEGRTTNDGDFIVSRIIGVRLTEWNQRAKIKLWGCDVAGDASYEDVEVLVQRFAIPPQRARLFFLWRNAQRIARAWQVWRGDPSVFDLDETLVMHDPVELYTTLQQCAQTHKLVESGCIVSLMQQRDAFQAHMQMITFVPLPCRTSAQRPAFTAVKFVYGTAHTRLVDNINSIVATMKQNNTAVHVEGNRDAIESLIHALVLTCVEDTVFVCSRTFPCLRKATGFKSCTNIAQCPDNGAVLVVMDCVNCRTITEQIQQHTTKRFSGAVFVTNDVMRDVELASYLVRGAIPVSMVLGTTLKMPSQYPKPECHALQTLLRPNRVNHRKIMVCGNVAAVGFTGAVRSMEERLYTVTHMCTTVLALNTSVLFVFSSSRVVELVYLEQAARRAWDVKGRSRMASVGRTPTESEFFVVGDPLIVMEGFLGMERDDVIRVTKYGRKAANERRRLRPLAQIESECDITVTRERDGKEVNTIARIVREHTRSFRCCTVRELACVCRGYCPDVVVLVTDEMTVDIDARCAFDACSSVLAVVGWDMERTNAAFTST